MPVRHYNKCRNILILHGTAEYLSAVKDTKECENS